MEEEKKLGRFELINKNQLLSEVGLISPSESKDVIFLLCAINNLVYETQLMREFLTGKATEMGKPLFEVILEYGKLEPSISQFINFLGNEGSYETHSREKMNESVISLHRDLIDLYEKAFSLNTGFDSSSTPLISFMRLKELYLLSGGDYFEPDLGSDLKRYIGDVNQSKKDLDALQRELRSESGNLLAKSYAKIFEKEAKRHSDSSWVWMGIGVLSISTFIFLIHLLSEWFPLIENQEWNVANIITKVIVLSVCGFFITFCFKQYNANRHLQTINRHRTNAMNTFDLFSKSVGKHSEEGKQLNLLLAKAIFENTQTTGFLGVKGEVSSSILDIKSVFQTNSTTQN